MLEGVLVSPTKTGTATFVCPKCGEILRETDIKNSQNTRRTLLRERRVS